MKNTVSTEIMLYNNSRPSSTTTIDDSPAKPPLAQLLHNDLSRACELQNVSNASADIVLVDNAGTDIKS